MLCFDTENYAMAGWNDIVEEFRALRYLWNGWGLNFGYSHTPALPLSYSLPSDRDETAGISWVLVATQIN